MVKSSLKILFLFPRKETYFEQEGIHPAMSTDRSNTATKIQPTDKFLDNFVVVLVMNNPAVGCPQPTDTD